MMMIFALFILMVLVTSCSCIDVELRLNNGSGIILIENSTNVHSNDRTSHFIYFDAYVLGYELIFRLSSDEEEAAATTTTTTTTTASSSPPPPSNIIAAFTRIISIAETMEKSGYIQNSDIMNDTSDNVALDSSDPLRLVRRNELPLTFNIAYHCSRSYIMQDMLAFWINNNQYVFMFIHKECHYPGCSDLCDAHGTCDYYRGECACDVDWYGKSCQWSAKVVNDVDRRASMAAADAPRHTGDGDGDGAPPLLAVICAGDIVEAEFKFMADKDHKSSLNWFVIYSPLWDRESVDDWEYYDYIVKDDERYEQLYPNYWPYVNVSEMKAISLPFTLEGRHMLQVFSDDEYNPYGPALVLQVLSYATCYGNEFNSTCSSDEECGGKRGHGTCDTTKQLCECKKGLWWEDCSRGCAGDVLVTANEGEVASDSPHSSLLPMSVDAANTDSLATVASFQRYTNYARCLWHVVPANKSFDFIVIDVNFIEMNQYADSVRIYSPALLSNSSMATDESIDHLVNVSNAVLIAQFVYQTPPKTVVVDKHKSCTIVMSTDQYLVGKGFRASFRTVLATQSPSPPPAIVERVEEKTSVGASIGIAIGAGVGVLLLVATIRFFYVRRQQRLEAIKEYVSNRRELYFDDSSELLALEAGGDDKRGGNDNDGADDNDEPNPQLLLLKRACRRAKWHGNVVDIELVSSINNSTKGKGKAKTDKNNTGAVCNRMSLSFNVAAHDVIEVCSPVSDEVYLCNRSSTSVAYAFLFPRRDGIEFDCRPGLGTLAANEKKKITISMRLMMTTRLVCNVRVYVTPQLTALVADDDVDVNEVLALGDDAYSEVRIDMSSALSDRIDPSEIELFGDPIASGAYGSVYRGTFRRRLCAIKIFKWQQKEYLSDQQMNEFMREIEILKRVRSPYIVEFIGASHIIEKLCILTEFYSRGSVGDVVDKYSIPLWLKYKLMFNMASSVSYLHSCNVLHRDIKLENWLVVSLKPSSRVSIKLCDFGCARNVVASNLAMKYTHGLGTIIYMAPEVLRRANYSAAADVYSLAISLWELLHQEMPWRDKKFFDISTAVMSGERPAIDSKAVYDDVRVLIERAWHADAMQRLAADELIRPLDEHYRCLRREAAAGGAGAKLVRLSTPSGRRATIDTAVTSSLLATSMGSRIDGGVDGIGRTVTEPSRRGAATASQSAAAATSPRRAQSAASQRPPNQHPASVTKFKQRSMQKSLEIYIPKDDAESSSSCDEALPPLPLARPPPSSSSSSRRARRSGRSSRRKKATDASPSAPLPPLPQRTASAAASSSSSSTTTSYRKRRHTTLLL